MKKLVLAVLLACSPLLALAQVVVKDPWVRATVAQQRTTGAFMQLTAPRDTRLVEVRSPVAGTVEIHEMSMDNNVMKMRAVSGIDLPAGKPVALKSGGYHVMLMDLKSPVKEGDSLPLTLVFESADKKRESMEIKVPARALNSSAPAEHKH